VQSKQLDGDSLFVSLLNVNLLWKRKTSLKFRSDRVFLVDASSSYLYRLAG